MRGVGGEFGFGLGDVDVVEEVEGQGFDFFEIVVVGEEGGEFLLAAVEAGEVDVSEWDPRRWME